MSKIALLLSWKGAGGTRVGQKAEGLLALPPSWVPDFVVMAPALIEEVEGGRPQTALERLSPHTRSEVERRLFRGAEHVLVRSDGPAESKQPGAGLSLACPASWSGIAECLERYKREVGELGRPIIQRAVEPGLLGVMSNARTRVPDQRLWVVEGILNLKEPHTRVVRPRLDDGKPRALRALTRAQLLPALRRACAHLGTRERRYRCEWIWDGERVWVLQADRTTEPPGDPTAMRYLGSCGPRARPRREDPAQVKKRSRRFAKLRSRSAFAELGMPLPPLKYITASEWNALDDRHSWLRQLLAEWPEPVIVRCDVAKGSASFLLPTSNPERSAAKLARFIEGFRKELVGAGLGENEILFLLSPLIGARVSALIVADAKAKRVSIDSLWGFPDGLLNLPHDSYALRGDRLTRREIRHKPACLLLEAGKTHRAHLGEPFNWEATLRSDELHQLAAWASALSGAQGQPISLMALCRIDGRRGPSACMPFHSWQSEADDPTEAQVEPLGVSIVRGPRDLRRKVKPGSTVKLELDEVMDRDVAFLDKVGEWASKHAVTLVFSGSLLGHTRAVLERTSAVVVSPEGFEVDWSAYQPTVVMTNAGIKRIRMVPSKECRNAPPSRDFRGICDLSEVGPTEVVETDLPGSPAMLMDDPRPG